MLVRFADDTKVGRPVNSLRAVIQRNRGKLG